MKSKSRFKETEIGMIPEDWEVRAIGDVADVIGGGTPSTKNPNNFGGDIPWITPRDLSNYQFRYIQKGERNITKEGLENSSAKLLPRETILLTTRAPIGYVAIADNEVTTNQGFRSLIPKREAISLFLYYLLKLNTEYLKAHSSGTTFGELSGSTLKSLKFSFPSITEQTLIAKILSDLDSKIELNQQMNKTLEAIGQAIFKRWFVEKEGNTKCISIADVVEFDPRILVKKGDVLPYVDMKELSTAGMTVRSVILKSFSGGARFQNGDTLLARITPCLENGKTAFVGFLTDEKPIGFGSTEFIVMRAKEGISPQFVYCLARNPEFRSFAIKSMIGSSGRQRVQCNMLESYEIFKPDQDSMNNFHKATFPLFSKVIENWKETRALMQIRDSLLPKLMSGKMRVPVEVRK